MRPYTKQSDHVQYSGNVPVLSGVLEVRLVLETQLIVLNGLLNQTLVTIQHTKVVEGRVIVGVGLRGEERRGEKGSKQAEER